MGKLFNYIMVNPQLIVEEKYFEPLKRVNFLQKLSQDEPLENYFELTFSHKKAYREIKAFRIERKEVFLKKYLKNFKEAYQEWQNINLLWKKNFPTSIPVLFFKNPSFVIIGTEKVKGHSFIDCLKLKPQKNPMLIEKIAQFLAQFHKEKFIHQDCYLNHFYWEEGEERLYIIDVPRVKYRPICFWYYQLKDLSQLRYSFYKYLGEIWKDLWELFLEKYQQEFGNTLSPLQHSLIKIKFYKIKKHTQKREKEKVNLNL
ncbi:MAG: lipopolysaccharide kinase InaA family protein [Caldimicrobium sp.]